MTTMQIERRPVRILPALGIVLAVAVIAVAGGLATDTQSIWYLNLNRPSWQPPNWLFGPVWTTIYALLALSAIIIWNTAPEERRAGIMRLYLINGILNLAWTFIFFQAHSPFWAGVEIIVLWITILLIMIRAYPISRTASLLLLPYLLWVGFASVLTWGIVGLN